ncbi:MAG: FGGY family carbohydrate kinase [Candidatus Limnocylindrales bacterium]
MGHVIGIDLGSQSLKGLLLDPGGRLIGEAQRAYELSYPFPAWAEQDPADWWAAIKDVVARLVGAARLAPGDVSAIAFASQVDGVVPVDARGADLHPAIVWLDRRAEGEAAALGRRMAPEELLERSGLNLDSSHVAPKILWLRANAPDAYARAATLHLPGSWAVARLTGRAIVDHSNASSTLLYDVRSRDWSPELLAAAEVERDRLPVVAASTDVAGTLTAAAAAALGLTTACLVAVGSGDEHAACLGAGVLRAGPICDIAGTAEPVAVASDAPIVDRTGLVETHAHADPRSWLIENPGFVSGGSVRWFNDTIGRSTIEGLIVAAAAVPAGSEGAIFVPALSGAMTPRWNGRARAVFHGLSMAHGLGHLARAVFEGCTFGLRDIVDRFAELGLGGGEIRVVGGGSKSDLLLQMKADVTGKPVRRVVHPEATALGATMIAAVAAGTFESLEAAAAALVRLEDVVHEPDPSVAGAYDDAYGTYRALYDAVEPLFDRGRGGA